MNYPDDFNTRTFPAGKSIAVSRAMGVGIMSAFFIIVCMCALLVWTIHSVRVEPFVLATGGINDQWRIVMTGGETPTKKMTDAELFQQSLIWSFTQNWFNISPNHDINSAVWNTDCTREQCLSDEIKTKNCALFCSSGDDLFYKFSTYVLPKLVAYESANATWMVVPESMRIEPVGRISNDDGTWRVMVTILTGGTGAMDIIAYAHVERNVKYFPSTRGYYIADFNAYRVSQ